MVKLISNHIFLQQCHFDQLFMHNQLINKLYQLKVYIYEIMFDETAKRTCNVIVRNTRIIHYNLSKTLSNKNIKTMHDLNRLRIVISGLSIAHYVILV